MQSKPLHVLILEDLPDDAELMLRELRRSGFIPTWQRVETEAAYRAALQEAADNNGSGLDLILADYHLPQFNALQALCILQVCGLDIPFLVVTGSISEAVAVECMKQGAADYLLKNHLQRLGPAVSQVLARKQLHQAKRRAEEALRQAEEKYRSIFENAVEGIFQITPEGQLLTANPALARMWGYESVEELMASLNSGFELYIEPNRWTEFTQLMNEQGEVYGFEVRSYCRDGSPIWISGNARTIRAGNGQVLYYEGTVENITARKQAEQEREGLIEELNAFAHMVAHDLKNPLGVIIGMAQLMEANCGGMPTTEVQDTLQAIVRIGRKMNNIVDELLVLAGVREQEIEVYPLDMAHIVAEAQQRLSHMIETRQAKIKAPATWPVVLGHAPWIEEVWVNYLSNGIKYGGQPPQLELGATEGEDGRVRFWVHDNGPGLTPEQRARLFTPFTRLNQVQTQGHGLGLSIARRIVEKLGGQVDVASNGVLGQGSIFSFTLPYGASKVDGLNEVELR
jgi:PAS domain S-box-containing protein